MLPLTSTTVAANAFLENVPVAVQLQSCHQKTIEEKYCHRLFPVYYSAALMICLLVRKKANEGGFFGFLILRIDSGDKK